MRVGSRMASSGVAWRLALTVWLVYVLHFASNVVRETYLAISLGESLSIRVDDYLGLHPDLFEIEGRGGYINNNPGASMLGAVPYAIAHPFIAGLLKLKPELARPKPVAEYDDARPNRNRFMNEARARGLDVKLGLAAAVLQAGLMAPLGALSAVLMFLFLRARLASERNALWLALLFAFGTPMFFRAAFINQNAIIAHAALIGFLAVAGLESRDARSARPAWRWFVCGLMLGFGILCDYSAAPLAVAFGVWLLALGWRENGVRGALRAGLWYVAGAAIPIAILFGYQWAAFGHPLYPAQRYMPDTRLSVRGWNGFSAPTIDLLWRNLFDPRFGLIVFCPMLAGAIAAPFLDRGNGPSNGELGLILGASVALYLFSSANQFALLQFNTGVRYLVPVVPLLFIALVPVLLRLSPLWRFLLIVPTVAISWSVSMARESVPVSLSHIFLGGFELPWLTVLRKTAGAYAPFLERGASPIPLFCLLGVTLWFVWRNVGKDRPGLL